MKNSENDGWNDLAYLYICLWSDDVIQIVKLYHKVYAYGWRSIFCQGGSGLLHRIHSRCRNLGQELDGGGQLTSSLTQSSWEVSSATEDSQITFEAY